MKTGQRKPRELGNGLGQHLRNFRLAKGLTLSSLANATGVSESYLSQLERGAAEPSLSTLRQLAHGLEVPVVALLDEGTPLVNVTRAHERPTFTPPESEATFALLTPDLNRKIEFLRIEIPPGKATYPESKTHPGEEGHFVLEGRVVVTLGGQEHFLAKGDAAYFLSPTPHKISNIGDTVAVLITVVTPPTPMVNWLVASKAGP